MLRMETLALLAVVNKQGNHQEHNYERQKHMPVEDAHVRSVKISGRQVVMTMVMYLLGTFAIRVRLP